MIASVHALIFWHCCCFPHSRSRLLNSQVRRLIVGDIPQFMSSLNARLIFALFELGSENPTIAARASQLESWLFIGVFILCRKYQIIVYSSEADFSHSPLIGLVIFANNPVHPWHFKNAKNLRIHFPVMRPIALLHCWKSRHTSRVFLGLSGMYFNFSKTRTCCKIC